MAKKTLRQKLSSSRRELSELRKMEPQGRLRRFVGDVMSDASAGAGSWGVIEAQKAGMFPAFPIDVVIAAPLRFLGTMRWLPYVSDVTREITGGHVEGRIGQMATLRALRIRIVDGNFVNGNGDPLPLPEE